MASADYPDPLTDWFRRHRVKLALLLFAFIMLGRLPGLLEGTTAGLVNFLYGAAFFGLLYLGACLPQGSPGSVLLASSRDRVDCLLGCSDRDGARRPATRQRLPRSLARPDRNRCGCCGCKLVCVQAERRPQCAALSAQGSSAVEGGTRPPTISFANEPPSTRQIRASVTALNAAWTLVQDAVGSALSRRQCERAPPMRRRAPEPEPPIRTIDTTVPKR